MRLLAEDISVVEGQRTRVRKRALQPLGDGEGLIEAGAYGRAAQIIAGQPQVGEIAAKPFDGCEAVRVT